MLSYNKRRLAVARACRMLSVRVQDMPRLRMVDRHRASLFTVSLTSLPACVIWVILLVRGTHDNVVVQATNVVRFGDVSNIHSRRAVGLDSVKAEMKFAQVPLSLLGIDCGNTSDIGTWIESAATFPTVDVLRIMEEDCALAPSVICLFYSYSVASVPYSAECNQRGWYRTGFVSLRSTVVSCSDHVRSLRKRYCRTAECTEGRKQCSLLSESLIAGEFVVAFGTLAIAGGVLQLGALAGEQIYTTPPSIHTPAQHAHMPYLFIRRIAAYTATIASTAASLALLYVNSDGSIDDMSRILSAGVTSTLLFALASGVPDVW